MFSGAISLLGSGALGAVLKIAAAMIQMRAEQKREHQAHETAKFLAHKDATLEVGSLFYGEGASGAFTRGTRRTLAIMFVGTFCATLLLWAYYPQVEIVVYQPSGHGPTSLFWGFIEWTPRVDSRITLTTGALVWAALHPLTMILTAYFMPVGKR